MLGKLREWLKPTPKTAEDVAAQQDAERLRQERETLKQGSFTGSSQWTHGGKESRGGQ
jgi:hypothetical protein